MNEVFAHSALIKHKHVVRYYNSWVENGRVYIQNEYCEGGSLAAKIQEFRMTGKRFTEAELKRILLHLAKGMYFKHYKFKKEKVLKRSLDSIPSSSPSVKIQINGGKVYLR